MNKIISILLMLCFIYGKANNIKVCKSCSTKSILSAVNLAKSGDTITIKKGIYTESEIELKFPITLIGENLPVIDGTGNGIIHILADSVTISGIKFINVKTSYTKDLAAIHAFKSNYFSIKNNILNDVFFGILLEKSRKGEVIGNYIKSKAVDEYNSGNGIHLWNCKEIRVSNNDISGMRDGIYYEFVSETSTNNNKSYHNVRYGLHFMFSNNNEYFNNTFSNNGAGVAVMFSKNIKMYRNKFIKNWGTASYGLLLKEINDAIIKDNIFEENTIGINAEGSNRIRYKHNTFLKNGWAVKISGACYNNMFEHNNFLSNAFDMSYQGSINENKFTNNYWSDYTGYDLDRNGIGDVPYRPIKLFSYIVNKTPETIILLRSLFVDIINFSEKVSPVFTPDNLIDEEPIMQMIK